MSVGIVFIGLFLAALGGFGTLHFSQRIAREEDQQRTVTVQALAEVVGNLQRDQGGLLARVATVEGKVAESSPPLMASIPSFKAPPAMTFPPSSNPAPPFALAPKAPPAMPDELLPHLPPVASGPSLAEEGETAAPAIKPPKLPSPPAAKKPQPPETAALTETPSTAAPSVETAPAPSIPTIAAREEEGPLTWQKRARLVKRLGNHPQHGIVIRAAAENAQAVKLAITLKSVFREAGWNVGEIEMVSRPLPAHTLLLSTGVFPPPQEFVAAYAALAGTGFLVTSDLDPNQSRQRVVVSVGPIR